MSYKSVSEYEVGDKVEIVNDGREYIRHYHDIGSICLITYKWWNEDEKKGGYWSYTLENEKGNTQSVRHESFVRARPKIFLDDSLFEVV